MAGVAYNGSLIADSTKAGHVTYDVYTWQQTGETCVATDPETGACTQWEPVFGWVYVRTDSTGAKISGTVSSISTVKVNGNSIAYVGSITNETWVADPPVPSNTSTTEYRNILPGTSGSGNGSVTGGNLNNVNTGGQSVANIGSQVTTHLSTLTTIASGSSNVLV